MASFNDKIKVYKPVYNWFRRNKSSLITTNFGSMNVVYYNHLFSGERSKVGIEHLIKFNPLLAPVFQKYDIRFDAFIIPERLQWKDCYNFYKGGRDGNTDYPAPKMPIKELYLWTAFTQMYIRKVVDDNVLNPFNGSLIDDFNLPTFDDLLKHFQGLSDSQLLDVWNSFILNANLDSIIQLRESDFDSQVFEVQDAMFSPWFVPGTVRNNVIRCLFLICLFYGGELGFDIEHDYLASSDFDLFNLHEAGKSPNFIPWIAYQSLWREYYRNQFVDDSEGGTYSWLTYPYLTEDTDVWDVIDYFDGKQLSFDIVSSTVLTVDPGRFVYVNPERGNNFMEFYMSSDASSLDGSNSEEVHALLNVFCKRDVNFSPDYFNTASLNSQLGPVVHMPLGTLELTGDGSNPSSRLGVGLNPDGSVTANTVNGAKIIGNVDSYGTIPELREANTLQRLLEKLALVGNRDYDWFRLIFGYTVSDERLQRPTFLGRNKSSMSISEVVQTSQSELGQPLGDMAGKGSSVNSYGLFDVTADEPCYTMVIMSVVPRQAYFQGIPYELTKSDRFDFLIPDFASIGMRAIDKSELYAFGGSEVFGYTDRYNEYKSALDEVHGDFRNSMSYWHSSRIFNHGDVELSPSFIRCDSSDNDLYRPFAVTSGFVSHLVGILYIHEATRRALDVYPHYSL